MSLYFAGPGFIQEVPVDHAASFAQVLKQRRKALDLTQQELAQRVGCALVTIQRIEQGTLRPSRQIVQRLVDIFDIPAAEREPFLRLARSGPPATEAATHTQADRVVGAQSTRWSLPLPLTPLIGRASEVAAVCEMLESSTVRLLTLMGPGGIGKTRLALQVAADLEVAFADGVHFVELASIRDDALVAPTIATMLGIEEAGGQSLLECLKGFMREKQLLLVLDNFEQVVTAAPVVAALLQAAPRLKVLLTSRRVVGISGEHLFEVPPLRYPDPASLLSLEQLMAYEAVRLFAERARALRADFVVGAENASAVAAICRQLEGVPLAIELAAARTKVLTPEALLVRLSKPLKLLTGGVRDVHIRQQTLRATIDWSYTLLEPAEQVMFRRLAVFVGGCTVEAAEAVCQSEGEVQPDVLDVLQVLVEKSLLRQTEGLDGEPRFGMLEMIREYALERLLVSGEAEAVRRQHAHFFLAVMEEAEIALQGPQQVAWLARLDAEHDNMRAVLAWSTSESREPSALRLEAGLRLAGVLHSFWERRGHLIEGRAWLAVLLSKAEQEASAGREPWAELVAKALNAAARLAYKQGDLTGARRLYEASLEWHTRLQDPRGRAFALVGLGHVARAYGDLLAARARYQEALALRQDQEDKPGVAAVLFILGQLAMSLGELEDAAALIAEAMSFDRALGNTEGLAYGLEAAGHIKFLQGDHEGARAQTEAAAALYRELGDKFNVADALDTLGWLAVHRGEYTRAANLFAEALALAQELEGEKALVAWLLCRLGIVAARQDDDVRARALLMESLVLFVGIDPPVVEGVGLCLLGFAGIAGAHQQPEQMTRLAGAAAALHESCEFVSRGYAQSELARTMAAARAALDEVTFVAAWAEGRAMTMEQAVAYALDPMMG